MNQPIPPLVEPLYEFLKKEVTWLHARWIIFEQLYRSGDLRLELLNEAGPSFFHMLQWMMYDDFQLTLAKLTDPARRKASLLQLQDKLESQADAKLAALTRKVLDKLRKSVEAIRDQRDSVLAHYSLDQAANPQAPKLPDVYYQDIVAALALVREYMNLVEMHYYGCEQGYEDFVWQDDGDNLVTLLRSGVRHRERLKTRGCAIEPRDKWSDA